MLIFLMRSLKILFLSLILLIVSLKIGYVITIKLYFRTLENVDKNIEITVRHARIRCTIFMTRSKLDEGGDDRSLSI